MDPHNNNKEVAAIINERATKEFSSSWKYEIKIYDFKRKNKKTIISCYYSFGRCFVMELTSWRRQNENEAINQPH